MERYPIPPKKRQVLEFIIRVLDMVVYVLVFFGGIYALWFTPTTIIKELVGWEWLILVWAGLLLIGGLLGLIGRASTIWILEPPADIAAAMGALIYAVVLGRTAFTTPLSTVAFCLVMVAFLAIVRRYVELHLFGSNPSARGVRSKWEDILTRRIPNVPPRG